MNALHPQRFIVLTLALSFAFTTARAQENADPYKKGDPKVGSSAKSAEKPAEAQKPAVEPLIQFTVEWVELKTEDAMPLLRDGLAPNSPELIQKIRDLEKQGKATLVDTASNVTRSGQRVSVEGTREHIYPTEYKELPAPNLTELNLSGNQLKDQHLAVSAESHSTPQPQAFTMRPVGPRMEVDPVLSEDGSHVECSVAPDLTLFGGTQPHGVVRLGGENVPAVEQPVFVSSKLQTSVILRTGHTLLAGVTAAYTPQGEADRTKKWFILIHAVVFPAN